MSLAFHVVVLIACQVRPSIGVGIAALDVVEAEALRGLTRELGAQRVPEAIAERSRSGGIAKDDLAGGLVGVGTAVGEQRVVLEIGVRSIDRPRAQRNS